MMSYSGFICAILAIVYLFTFGRYFLEINKSHLDIDETTKEKEL